MQVQESSLLRDDHKYKVVFLGESSVGKTSLVQLLSTGSYSSVHDPTIYLDSVRKNVAHNGRLYKLIMWDTAGQQKFNSLVPSAIRGSQCAVIVFSVDDRRSFQKCQHWVKMLQACCSGEECPVLLVGNKTDLGRCVTQAEGFDLAVKYVSAKNGSGATNIIPQIIQSIEGKIERSTKSSEENNSGKQLSSKISNRSTKISSSGALALKKQSNCCCAI